MKTTRPNIIWLMANDMGYGDPGCNGDGRIATPNMDRVAREGMPKGKRVADWKDGEIDVRFLEAAQAFIEETAGGEKPFFLYLAASAPHSPWIPPAFLKGQSAIGDRGDLILALDWMVGEIFDQLERLGVVDETLFIVTSDNGGHEYASEVEAPFGHLINGDLRGYKTQIWDGGHRVPFLARWPAEIPPGAICDRLIGLQDLFATCAEICGAAVPENAAEDSVSFLGSLRDPPSESGGRTELAHHSALGRFSIREQHWKLIDACDGGGFGEKAWREPGVGEPVGQLYRLDTDPAEQENLWNAEPEVRERLLARLMEIQDGRRRP